MRVKLKLTRTTGAEPEYLYTTLFSIALWEEKFNKKPREDRKPSDMYQISILDAMDSNAQNLNEYTILLSDFKLKSKELEQAISDKNALFTAQEYNTYLLNELLHMMYCHLVVILTTP